MECRVIPRDDNTRLADYRAEPPSRSGPASSYVVMTSRRRTGCGPSPWPSGPCHRTYLAPGSRLPSIAQPDPEADGNKKKRRGSPQKLTTCTPSLPLARSARSLAPGPRMKTRSRTGSERTLRSREGRGGGRGEGTMCVPGQLRSFRRADFWQRRSPRPVPFVKRKSINEVIVIG